MGPGGEKTGDPFARSKTMDRAPRLPRQISGYKRRSLSLAKQKMMLKSKKNARKITFFLLFLFYVGAFIGAGRKQSAGKDK